MGANKLHEMSLDKDSKYPLYLQVADNLRDKIIHQALAENVPLSDERTLAKELAVSRVTIRKALEILLNEGLIYKIQSRGIFVGKKSDAPGAQRDRWLSGITVALSTYFTHEEHHNLPMLNGAVQILQQRHCNAIRLGYIHPQTEYSNFVHYRNIINGVIMRPSGHLETHRQTFRYLQSIGLPVVFVGHDLGDIEVDYVKSDDAGGMREAMAYLLGGGHRRIAYVSGNLPFSPERRGGYLAAMAAAGLEPQEESSKNWAADFANPLEWGYRAGLKLLKLRQRPTAICTENDMMAIGVYNALQDLKIPTPQEVELIGFGDDLEAHVRSVNGQLAISTVSIPRAAIGAKAAELIVERIYQPRAAAQCLAVPVSFIRRQTTRP